EALDAHREPVDARVAEARELLALERAGIRFHRDLGVRRTGHARAYARQQSIDRSRREEARRSAANEDRDDAPAPDRRQRRLEIGEQRVDVSRFGHIAARLVRVEIAVRALPETPW